MRLCFNFQYSHAGRIFGTLLENNKKQCVKTRKRVYWIVFSGVNYGKTYTSPKFSVSSVKRRIHHILKRYITFYLQHLFLARSRENTNEQTRRNPILWFPFLKETKVRSKAMYELDPLSLLHPYPQTSSC